MTNDNNSGTTNGETPKRSRSGTSSPYFDLDTSIKVAETIHSMGGGSCSSDQLAHWLNYKTTRSGTYLTRIAAARQFGLIESSGDRHSVTDRGMRIVAPVMDTDVTQAKIDAFMDVELFSKVFQRFRGSTLPTDGGLKNLFASPDYAILPDRIDAAIRVLTNSAEQAGFLVTNGDQRRLIMPSVVGATTKAQSSDEEKTTPTTPAEKPKGSSHPTIEHTSGVHSAIVGLLRELPPPGTPWPSAKKQRFLTAFQSTIDFIYPEDES
ncbi:hypothetical protein LRK24_07975 [Rhodanobacter denitrificans]|uniref:hypothetical protein n=1 Tax=Rhodanobacter denitrificans TaxID=666685 RepID=UPI000260FF34|nr:hypothetical protein [Rhodanobacter denitrificans]EIM01466.1 hypothetical protein UUC_11329 [Rhodanobacter denitrificans]UJM91847.1 hypothetical protein LRK24_07975 [Rhodanobacter denitrificans]